MKSQWSVCSSTDGIGAVRSHSATTSGYRERHRILVLSFSKLKDRHFYRVFKMEIKQHNNIHCNVSFSICHQVSKYGKLTAKKLTSMQRFWLRLTLLYSSFYSKYWVNALLNKRSMSQVSGFYIHHAYTCTSKRPPPLKTQNYYTIQAIKP